MSRKIRISGALLIIVVFLVGLIFACSLAAKSVGEVGNAKLVSVGSNNAQLKWSRVGSADGYFVYAKASNEQKYAKIATVKDGKTTSINAKKLASSCDYSAYVSAFKNTKNGYVESEKHKELTFKTAPQIVDMKLSSEEKGCLNIKWTAQQRIDGYELQYALGKTFENAQDVSIDDASKAELKIEKLEIDKVYTVKIRAYYMDGENKVYGEWCEPAQIKIMQGVDLTHLDPTKPMVALTYDDGPGYNKASGKILDVLEKYGVRATFFMVGKNAADHPENVKRKIKLGCQIGNHTYDHNHYGKNVTANDIKKSSDAIKKAGGVYPTCFRSPGGMTTEGIRNECKKENMPLYYWSLDTQDWKYRDADRVYKTVMNNVQDGDIILMHEIYDSTAVATAKIVPELIKRGYQIVTCDELVAVKGGKPAQAGTQYVNATTIKNKTS